MQLTLLIIGLVMFFVNRLFTALTADREVDRAVDQELRSYPVAAGVTIYKGSAVGINPAGYAKPFEAGDDFIGLAYEQIDASSDTTAGTQNIRVYVQGDFQLTLASASVKNVGDAVYATDSGGIATTGHPDGFVGRVINYMTTNTVLVRLKAPGESPLPSDTGSLDLVSDFGGEFAPTGADGATDGPQYTDGLKLASALGLGVAKATGEDGGATLSLDAVAEIGSATIQTSDLFPVDKGITFEADLHLTDIGDDAALDVDWGLGTLLTANSVADIGHADMVNLAAFHMDGSSADIKAQSDDDTTVVAATDTTIDNATAAGSHKKTKIIVRTSGTVEYWVNGVRVLDSTSFAVAVTAALAAFVNMEKTSNDTTAAINIRRLRVAGGRAA